MFKLTGRAGLRRAGGGGVTQSSRIGGLSGLRARPLATDNHRRPAFLPDTPQEQTMDSNSPRLGGLEDEQ